MFKTKILSVFILIFFTLTTYAQSNITQYLKTHHYSFTLDEGFDQPTTDTLKQKLRACKLILEAEGGSHYLNFYKKLPFVWIRFLNLNFQLTHFFLEAGHTSDILMNKYLQTGDSSYFYLSNNELWKTLYNYNLNLAPNKKLKYFGIDFERTNSYLKALKSILPATLASLPENIKASIELVKTTTNSLKDCDYIISINEKLKKDLANYKEEFVQYFGANYTDFEKIILNNGNCNDRFRDRNKNMASNFLSFDKDFQQPIYYGELGEAHTILMYKNVASIVNRSSEFKHKVCVVNLYCYNCTTTEEQVSNWQLKKIERDILEYFLPYCSADFTLFDLSDNSEITKKYRDYGQFLIIAKDQN